MTIGEVARLAGITASSIRFYEQEGVLPKPVRVSGKRVYDRAILEKLAVVERAKGCRFSLAEIRLLLFGFRADTPPSERWRMLANRKIAELDELSRKIEATRELLQRPCACQDLSECGRRIAAHDTTRKFRRLTS